MEKIMEVINRKLSELISAEYNPRKITGKQMEELKDSIKRLGHLEPIVVNMHPDRKNIIISGHQRSTAAKELGMTEFPCVEVAFDLNKEREANIRMNKSGGEFDMAILTDLFQKDELTSWGFEDFELDSMVDDIDLSALDGEDVDKEIGDMESGVKKAIQIEFETPELYEEAQSLIKFWRDRQAQIGSMLIEKLTDEKRNIS
jgi:hypothetical protein